MSGRILPFFILSVLCCVSVSAQTPTPSPSVEATATPLTSRPSQNPVSSFLGTDSKSSSTPARVGVNLGQTLPLSLNDAIRRTLENNNDIEVARNDVRINETTLRSLEGFYDPYFSITPNYSKQIQPQPTELGGAGSTGTTTSSQFRIDGAATQFIKPGGGNYNVFFNNNRQTTSSIFSQLNPSYSTNLGINFTQPLLRNRSIDLRRREIKIQRKRLEQSDADFRRRTIETIAQTQRAYWDLVFALRDQQNRQSNLDLTRENLRRVEAQIAAGAAAPLARAEVATELANREGDLLLAAQNVTTAENTLKGLFLKDPNAPEWSVPLVPTDDANFAATPIKLEDALTEAKENRPELKRLGLQREINDIDLKYFKNQVKPRIDFVSDFSLIGLSGNVINTGSVTAPLISGDPNADANALLLREINSLRALQGLPPVQIPDVTFGGSTVPSNFNGGYFRSLQNLFAFDTRSYTVGVTIEFPLRNKTAKADLAGAQIQRTRLEAEIRSQEQLVIAEVRNAVQAVETARQRIVTAQAARENAQIQLQGEQKLYEVGRSTTFLLFQRENALINAQNAEIRAQTDYNKALAELQRATSTTLRANHVIVESSVTP